MSISITLGYSPCPNDTFIFYGLTQGRVHIPGIEFHEQLEDVETLNRMALNSTLDITKVSFHAIGHLRQQYALLRSGGALGRGCGPLIVARQDTSLLDIRKGPVAIPGKLTTAYLLLQLYDPAITNIVVMPFDRIMDAVARKEVIAGIIIHESRFTYPLYNLVQVLDLGEWWERHSGLPVPLGGILGKRSLGKKTLLEVESGIRESLTYALAHPAEVLAYCRLHSQEMDDAVMQKHIDLYVNAFSHDLGAEGIAAITRLFRDADALKLFPASDQPLLAEE